ncbi:FtsW/RodA/SpoVE family cell cycle protein [Peribacillus frigoritolerans]|nr:FtsW/RodA/SpoVE family cell cycle protein [Peribacillus frigoritolerans]
MPDGLAILVPLEHLIFSNEMMTDFIFVTITYTLGWAGALLIGLLFLWMIWRISHIFQTVKDPFGKMLVSGSFAIFTAQVTVSIGMSLGLLPIISISLPFMSYGALSATVNACLFGLVLSVYHKKRYYTDEENMRIWFCSSYSLF